MRNYAAIHCGYSLVLVCSAEFILQQQLTKISKIKYENNNNLIVLISIDELFFSSWAFASHQQLHVWNNVPLLNVCKRQPKQFYRIHVHVQQYRRMNI